ncbi:P-loop containing nucleoside triphosphate hydrolase protein [Tuber indicum]|nr:P-loop containing nucleoside triphosphate hydrolase protein [Tuber indicum]
MPRRPAPGMEAPDCWNWLEIPPIHFPKHSMADNLIQLASLCVLRCTYRMIADSTARVRIYMLPDDVGRRVIPRDSREISKFRREVLYALDTSEAGWQGLKVKGHKPLVAPGDVHLSLFYLFNTLDSPNPNPKAEWVRDRNTTDLMNRVLKKPVVGMKNPLYGYQKKTVAMMIQRELAPENTQDARFRCFTGPQGRKYYLDLETTEMLVEPRKYEDVRGGILAEDTGTGKTFICLALILATKYQYSFIPEEHEEPSHLRQSPPSLSDLAVAAIWKHSLGWGEFKDDLGAVNLAKLRAAHAFYEVQPPSRSRSKRYSPSDVKERIYLGTGTIVVCPPNLVDQWKREINIHVAEQALKTLVLVKSSEGIPPVSDLLEYDLVIIARPRFDMEEREGRDKAGRRESGGKPLSCRCPYKGATRIADCVCFDRDAVYKSPLMSIRWKRLIVDEGHSMASSSSLMNRGVCVAQRLPVERRWIVSATPVTGLLGMSSGMNIGETEEALEARREQELEERRVAQTNESNDLEKLGRIVCDFLRVRPWALPSEGQSSEYASWKAYVSKGFMQRQPGSTDCVRSILQRIMIRHRLKDIEKDVALPPLYHTPVYLEPGFFERLSMNLFLGGIASNAVTSERVDQDYMFHPKNRGPLRELTNNLLKRSGFYWMGHSSADVQLMVAVSQRCLADPTKHHNKQDRELLESAIESGLRALSNPVWNACIRNSEMAYSVLHFPASIAAEWALVKGSNNPYPIGGKSVQDVQRYVNAHAYDPKLISKLGDKVGVAAADVYLTGNTRRNGKSKMTSTVVGKHNAEERSANDAEIKSNLKSILKRCTTPVSTVSEDSPLARTEIIGTASQKLTYLLDKVLEYHETEKILIFYESEDVAFYIAQGLEIIGVEYLGYQKNLPSHEKAKYLVTFQFSQTFRVFLMDLSQAAFGLNISAASRIFFVNPVWQPSVEHQALARAHRIGQKRPVYAETLILNHTIEREMWDRRQGMTAAELNLSKGAAANDSKMRDIISSTRFLKTDDTEGEVDRNGNPNNTPISSDRFASLKCPQSLLGPGKHGGVYSHEGLDDRLRKTYKAPRDRASSLTPTTPDYLELGSDEEIVSDLRVAPPPKRRASVASSGAGSSGKKRRRSSNSSSSSAAAARKAVRFS